MAITAEQQNSRLEGPKPPKGKIVLQAPPELEPSDGVNTLLTSLVPLLGTASAMVMMLMTNSGLTGMLTGGMFMVSSLGFVAVNASANVRNAWRTSRRQDVNISLIWLAYAKPCAPREGNNAMPHCGTLHPHPR